MSQGLYVAKKDIEKKEKTADDDGWTTIKVLSKKPKKNKRKYSYEENLKKREERKKKNYLYKLNKNKKELEKFVRDNSLFIQKRLDEGYIIVNEELKQNVNKKLDTLDEKLDLALKSENIREFVVYKDQTKQAIDEIDELVNKSNFLKYILQDMVSNVNIEVIHKIKESNKSIVLKKPEPKVYRKIEPGVSFLDILNK